MHTHKCVCIIINERKKWHDIKREQAAIKKGMCEELERGNGQRNDLIILESQ